MLCCAIVSWAVACDASIPYRQYWLKSQKPRFRASSLLTHLGEKQKTAQVVGPLNP